MRSTISGYTRLPKIHKLSVAGIAATGAAVVAVAVAPNAFAAGTASAPTAAVKPVAWSTKASGETQQDALEQHTAAAVTAAKADAGKASADKERAEKQAANRSTERKAIEAKPAAPAKKAYANDVDGWISEALDILRAKGIPASYDGIKRNVMRESTGNPRAINDWDVNAVNGVPSKGLLQMIDPTFKAYHVEGTSWDIYDPVANITAACNYAADKYGSMDNVNSAY
ncbi:transglycosylase SLT domain-containing protein [Streptomyces sp. VNUA116]|uniref:transglycosylase SLT domain-containing protein n=1 Tax=Streptomyces sp. VNUA116 TaxID=3062449 RepID=UPI002676EA90|nr:transglycosylase SLT domain-containing protein [Streptomyces sp. VNUA116]WKU43367.1 transglycosylase SLT domain-containing protein [Streptomyces sp. VNUA116]